MINLALIGCGRFGKNFIKTINNLPNIQLFSIYSSNRENINLVDNLCIYYSDWKELISNKYPNNIDGVIIATPPNTHQDIVAACIAHKIPFLCEKPLCDNLRDTIETCDLIDNYKVPCLIDYTQLYNPAFITAQKIIAEKEILPVSITTLSNGPFRKDVSMFWDWLPHDFALLYTLHNSLNIKDAWFFKGKNDNSGEIFIKLDKSNIHIHNENLNKSKHISVTYKDEHGFVCPLHIYGNTLKQWVTNVQVPEISPLENVVNTFVEVVKNKTLMNTAMTRIIAEKIDYVEKLLTSKKNQLL